MAVSELPSDHAIGGDAWWRHGAAGVLPTEDRETRELPSSGFEGSDFVICFVFSVLGGHLCWQRGLGMSVKEAESCRTERGQLLGFELLFLRVWWRICGYF